MNRIIRVKNENYTTISNVFLRDENLSCKAKGFLAIIMGLPEDWDFSINGICSILKEGKTAVYNIISELKETGYCKYELYRNERGLIMGNDYSFFEEPFSEEPQTENLNMDNQPQLSTKLIKEKKLLNTKLIKGEEKKILSPERKKNKPEINLSFVSAEYLEVVKKWLEYKTEIGDKYKGEISIEAMYRKLVKLSKNNPDIANEIIEQSMANNWKGLFELKTSTTAKTQDKDDWKKKLIESTMNEINSL